MLVSNKLPFLFKKVADRREASLPASLRSKLTLSPLFGSHDLSEDVFFWHDGVVLSLILPAYKFSQCAPSIAPDRNILPANFLSHNALPDR